MAIRVHPNLTRVVSLKEEEVGHTHVDTRRRPREDTTGGSHLEVRGETSRDAEPVETVILDFQPPDCEKINFYCLNLPTCGNLLWQA